MFERLVKWYEQEWYSRKKIISEWDNSYLVKYFYIDGEFGSWPSYYDQIYDGYKMSRLRLFVVSIEWGYIVMSKSEWKNK